MIEREREKERERERQKKRERERKKERERERERGLKMTCIMYGFIDTPAHPQNCEGQNLPSR